MASGEFPINPDVFDWGTLMGAAPAEGVNPELFDRIRDAIDELPDLQRDVINALFYEGLTKTEAVEALGTTKHYLYDALDRAVAALREALADAV